MVVILFDCFRQIADENHSLMPNFVKVTVKHLRCSFLVV